MLKEEIKNIKETKKDLRKFGLTVGSVLFIIAILLFLFDKPSYIYFGIISGILLILGFIFPNILKPANKVWMTLALILGWFMSRVILIILFYLVVTPIGFIAKIFNKRFLSLKIDKSTSTYWEKRKHGISSITDYERQF